MAISRMSLLQVLHKLGVEQDPNFVREAMEALVQAVMERKASMKAGAERYERSPEGGAVLALISLRRGESPWENLYPGGFVLVM